MDLYGNNKKGEWIGKQIKQWCNHTILDDADYGRFIGEIRRIIAEGDRKYPLCKISEFSTYKIPVKGYPVVTYRSRCNPNHDDVYILLTPVTDLSFAKETAAQPPQTERLTQ